MGRVSDASEGREDKGYSDVGSRGSECSEGQEHRPGPKGGSESSTEGSEGSECKEQESGVKKMEIEIDLSDLYNRTKFTSPFQIFHF